MLEIVVGKQEYYDHEKQEFLYRGGTTLVLEHSLASLSKWEQKFKKPFLSSTEKTTEEVIEYIKMMVVVPVSSPVVFEQLDSDALEEINIYLNDSQTATWFSEDPTKAKGREIITNELIYYWMMTAGIPMECQYWHLNRLFTLIRVFSAKNEKPKKMSKAEISRRNRELNEQRRKELGSKG